MKKKIFSLFIMFVLIIPCSFLFTACGKVKDLDGRTYVYDRIEVSGSVLAEDYISDYKSLVLSFSETEVDYSNGVGNQDTYDYKIEDGKLYIKDKLQDEFPESPYAEVSGKYLIIAETVNGGTIKIYLKKK